MTNGINVPETPAVQGNGPCGSSRLGRHVLGCAAAAMAVLAWSAPGQAQTDSFTDFEPAGFADGETVDNHKTDGTEASPEITFGNACVQAWFVPTAELATPADEEIVDLSGNKAWRYSQAAPSVPLGQNPHSPNSDFVSGEAGASNDAGCGAPTTANFYGEVMFTSATGASQANLDMNLNANSADTRHAFTRIIDDGTGSSICSSSTP